MYSLISLLKKEIKMKIEELKKPLVKLIVDEQNICNRTLVSIH